MLKTSDIKAALRRYYKPAEYALMFEVANSTGHSARRYADAIAMNLWPSRGLLIEGVEIKVSRSDWRRELDNPAKAETIHRFCDQWWIVAPEGIVQEHEVPALWGYRTVSEALVVKTVKMAPRLAPEVPSKGFVASMLRRASEADAAEVEALVEAKMIVERAQIAEKVDKLVKQRTARSDKLQATVDKFKELGIDLGGHFMDASEIVADYKLGAHMRKNYAIQGLPGTAKRLEEAAATLREVHEVLSRESTNS